MTLSFHWRTVLLAIWLVGVGWYVRGQVPVWTLVTGTVTATETEATECYFQIGHGAMLVFRPGSTPCQIAQQELLGRSIRLQAVIEAP